MKAVCLLVLVLICATLYSQSDSLLYEELDNVIFTEENDRSPNVVKLSRKQFLTMAGALEDPTRLLIKSPGISTANDGANSVVYHGMPSQFHLWTMNGARILNPNHLNNAGTSANLPNPSSGGVNMLSGQVIGSLEFHGNPSSNALRSVGSSSNLTLRSPYENSTNINLSLIGIEAGIDRVFDDGKSSIMANARYSTVGFLTGVLGLDFGGEVINYQDLTVSYDRKFFSKGNLKSYAVIGRNINDKAQVPIEERALFIDSQQINADGFNQIYGLHFDNQWNDQRLDITLNFSSQAINQKAFVPLRFNTQTTWESTENLSSLYLEYSKKWKNIKLGSKLTTDYNAYDFDYNAPPIEGNFLTYDVSTDHQRFIISPSVYVSSNSENRFSYYAEIGYWKNNLVDFFGVDFHEGGDVIGAADVSYISNKFLAKLSFSRGVSGPQNVWASYGANGNPRSYNAALTLKYAGFQIQPFYHRIDRLLSMRALSRVYTTLENFDYLPPFINTVSTTPIFTFIPDSQSEIVGTTIAYDAIFFGISASTNLTLFDGGVDNVFDIPNNYGHVFNLSLAKKWELRPNKVLGVSLAFHHRGGGRERMVSTSLSTSWGRTDFEDGGDGDAYSVQLGNYYRADVRIYYQASKRSTVSLDIQNATNRLNDAGYYYEPTTTSPMLRSQLGLIPVLSWRKSW